MTSEKILFGPIWAKIYHFGFLRWKYAPISISLTETHLIGKYWGLFKVRNIPLSDILEVKIIDERWINKWVPNSGIYFVTHFMNNPLIVKYKSKSNVKTDYIIAHIDHKNKLLGLIIPRIGS